MNARRRWEGGGSMNPTRVLTRMDLPVVAAPMAGGPSTAELAAAVSEVGGVGFLAGGYLHPDQVREQIQAVRRRTGRDFGVNLFVGGSRPADPPIIAAYLERLKPMMQAVGVTAGVPRFDDDGFVEKLSIVTAERVPVVSFTFGLPEQDAVRALQEVGSEVWATVTSPEEAQEAVGCGADALVVQGIEAGGHRGVFVDDKDQSDLTLLTALELVRAVTDTPLVAAGGLMTGAALAAALVAGASAGQLGSAYLRCDEAGTSDVHRAAVASSGRTVLTRAFSGRLARGVGALPPGVDRSGRVFL
jgi:nitronate monooxygenase